MIPIGTSGGHLQLVELAKGKFGRVCRDQVEQISVAIVVHPSSIARIVMRCVRFWVRFLEPERRSQKYQSHTRRRHIRLPDVLHLPAT